MRPASQPVIEGRRIFEKKGCVQCHTVWGSNGGQRMGPDLGGKASSWRDVMRFASMLWNHTPEMIEEMSARQIQRSTLSPDEMRMLTTYLFWVKLVGGPGDVERGRKSFEQRLCSRCHQFAGQGGTVGPRLDELKAHMSSFFMARALWNHGPEMTEKMAELGLARPQLEGNDVADIVAFIRGGAQPAGPLELAYSQAGIPREGESLFRAKGCIKCHSVGGMGGALAPDLRARGPGLYISEMAGALWNHGTPMWAKMKKLGVPFPRLTDGEMADLLAYLAFLQYVGPRGDVARGGEVFREKRCSECHAASGKGPAIGPDLTASDAVQSVLHWAAAMWNHAPAMKEKTQELHIPWPRFTDDQMSDLVAFLQSHDRGK
jgi:mono/diheme cytochrome c family protein